MRWLLHGPMTAAVGDALRRHEHEAIDLATPGPAAGGRPARRADGRPAGPARHPDHRLRRFAAAPYLLEFWFQRSIVYLQLDGADVEQDDAIDRLFERYKTPTPGRLYTVTGSRVKVRQLPGRH